MNKIIITVDGGIIENIENVPEGVVVEVRDFDTEGIDDDSKISVIDGKEAVVTLWF